MKSTVKKSRFTLFFAKLPQGRIDPRVRINATFDVIRDCFYAKDFRLRPDDEEFEVVRHAVTHLIHQASTLNNFLFWDGLSFFKNPLRGVVLERSPSKRKRMLSVANNCLRQGEISLGDLVIAMDAVYTSICSMDEQFVFGTGEKFLYEGWDPQLAIFMCAALLPTMASRLHADWVRLRGRILERCPHLLKDVKAA